MAHSDTGRAPGHGVHILQSLGKSLRGDGADEAISLFLPVRQKAGSTSEIAAGPSAPRNDGNSAPTKQQHGLPPSRAAWPVAPASRGRHRYAMVGRPMSWPPRRVLNLSKRIAEQTKTSARGKRQHGLQSARGSLRGGGADDAISLFLPVTIRANGTSEIAAGGEAPLPAHAMNNDCQPYVRRRGAGTEHRSPGDGPPAPRNDRESRQTALRGGQGSDVTAAPPRAGPLIANDHANRNKPTGGTAAPAAAHIPEGAMPGPCAPVPTGICRMRDNRVFVPQRRSTQAQTTWPMSGSSTSRRSTTMGEYFSWSGWSE